MPENGTYPSATWTTETWKTDKVLLGSPGATLVEHRGKTKHRIEVVWLLLAPAPGGTFRMAERLQHSDLKKIVILTSWVW